MDSSLLVIALLGAFAIAVSKIAKRFVPEIVIFLVLGLAIGPDGPMRLINERNSDSLDLLTQVALGAVIFTIGDRLRLDDLRRRTWDLVPVNAAQLVLSAGLVFAATRWAGATPQVALILGLIAAESGILTISATVKEERAHGPFTDLLMASVGVTNVAVALLFGLALPFVLLSSGQGASWGDTAQVFGRLVVLSTAIGLAGGWLLRRFSRTSESSGELLLLLLVVLTGVVGAAVAADGSVVVSTLVAGLYVANAAPWLADRLFAAVRTLEAPIYLVFFVVAGASIHVDELASVGLVGAAYVAARLAGKVAGAAAGGLLAPGLRSGEAGRVGLALLPHAGMAIGLVALVVEQAPWLGGDVSAVVLGSIVAFELGGPIAARRALRAAEESGKGATGGRRGALPGLTSFRTFDRVLVPVGTVEILLPRLPFLLDLVGTMQADLVAVHVSRPGSAPAEDAEHDVLTLVQEMATERNIACTVVHRVSDHVAATIVETVREQAVDLVVLGEPVRTAQQEPPRWGLVSQRVVAAVDVPVLVYPVDPAHPERVPSVYLRRAARVRTEPAQEGEAGDRAARH
ncbi:MAG: cation:proton antiporter [Euzebyaceae bacterium]|nr:cation:proton antiporter [Euzebyaceae bacterium]